MNHTVYYTENGQYRQRFLTSCQFGASHPNPSRLDLHFVLLNLFILNAETGRIARISII